MKKIIQVAVFGLALGSIATIGGCDKGKDEKAAKTNEKAPAAKAGPNDKAIKGDKGDVGDKGDKAEPAEAEGPALDPKVEQAVNVANQISAKPGDADSILEAAGMDRAAFEQLLYEIAKDPELSKSYAIAREA